MATYKIDSRKVTVSGKDATLFTVGFADPGHNSQIVRDATARLAELGEVGGGLALVNGPASLPVAMVLAHHLAHRYGTVACFDPKHPVEGGPTGAYVVAISHGGEYNIGDLIPGGDVK